MNSGISIADLLPICTALGNNIFNIMSKEVIPVKGTHNMRLKVAAARKGITMRQYSLSALEQELEKDEIGVLTSGAFNRETVEKAKALQNLVFGKRTFTDESTELIRQAREERVRQL